MSLLQSNILNNISILEIGVQSTLSDGNFSGLNYFRYNNLFRVNNEDELYQHENKTFDYITIHQYDLQKETDWISSLKKYNIKCKEFIIDLLGEGHDLHDFLHQWNDELKTIDCNKIKILAPFNDFRGLEEEYPHFSFFKTNFGGPRIFCSIYNRQMIHGHYKFEHGNVLPATHKEFSFHLNEVVLGTSWNDSRKEKLFMCLNNEPREHRCFMVKSLIDSELINLGYVSFRSDVKIFKIWKKDVETINIPQILLEDSHFNKNRFGLIPSLSQNSYINIITESSHNIMKFMTEKSVLPFYQLQFPMILGYSGIISDLRNEGFDMFDDLIDHSYDDISFQWQPNRDINEENIASEVKSKMISNELLRLSKLDLHSFYIKNKERLLYNQNLLFQKTIKENNIFEELGNFIFGDNIEVKEYDGKIKKLVIDE